MKITKIVIGSDHAGFKLKQDIISHLRKKYDVEDVGAFSEDSVDYPDFGFAAAKKIEQKEADIGIVICGSGIGISIAANRNPAVRAALVHNEEAAKLARQHNDANIIALGARMTDAATAVKLVDIFLATPFEGGRHAARVEKLSC